jgi:hypothetical protein
MRILKNGKMISAGMLFLAVFHLPQPEKISNGLVEVRINEKEGSFEVFDVKRNHLIISQSTIGFTTKPYVDLRDLGRISIETEQPATGFNSSSAQNQIAATGRIGHAFPGGKSLSLISRIEKHGELEVQFTLYSDSSFVEIGFAFKNLEERPVRLNRTEVIKGTVMPGFDSKNRMILDGNSGAGQTAVSRNEKAETENNILCFFANPKQPHSMVAGGLTYQDYRKWVQVSHDTLMMYAEDVVGKRVDPGKTYAPEDRFYLDGLTENPFEALEAYAAVTKKARGIDLNYYPFPSVCMWFLSVTHFGAAALNAGDILLTVVAGFSVFPVIALEKWIRYRKRRL